jgi:peptidoglycan/LPS O-acetylase OafA/YrhL
MNYPSGEAGLACAAALIVATLCASLIGQARFPVPSEDRRVGCIDGLRGYLALFVLCGHALIWINVLRGDGEWRGIDLYPFNGLGGCAVPLFFMITGTLFYPRVLKGFRGTNWASTYISRAFRILPLVTCSVALVSVVIALRHGIPDGYRLVDYVSNAGHWILSLGEPPIFRYEASGRVNAYVLWSLTYEWIFYLTILPVLALLMSCKPRVVPSWIVPGGLLFMSLALRPLTESRVVHFLPLFAVGMLAFEIRAQPLLRRSLSSGYFSFVAIVCLLAAAGLSSDGASFVLSGVFFAAVVCGNSFWGLLKSPGATVLGECSFGIYVLHGLLLSLFFEGQAASGISIKVLPIAIPLLAASVVPITACAYLLIERPFISLGARLARRITSKPPQLIPAVLDAAPELRSAAKKA